MTQPTPPPPRGSIVLPILLGLCVIYIFFSNFFGCARARELKQLKNANQQNEQYINRLHMQLDSLSALLGSSYDNSQSAKNASKTSASGEPSVLFGADINDKGTHFEVQIGAFQFFDLHKYRPGFNQSFREEHDKDELDKYTIAKFRSYAEAQSFRNDIIRLGIDDAWIVAKVDGKRVDINSVLRKG